MTPPERSTADAVLLPEDELDLGMSNFDHAIDAGFEDALRAAPNKAWGRHAGWNFNAKVWFDGEQFVSEPWHYHSPQERHHADTLRDLMESVNEEWGAE